MRQRGRRPWCVVMDATKLKDYYGLLEVSPFATASDIHKAYWRRASRCHPDKGGSHEGMLQLSEAWKILSDPEKRSRYDQLLSLQHEDWSSRQFNKDIQDARKHAKDDSSQTWAEFEAIYQKAFSTFNEDFYGDNIKGTVAGPYSPLMRSTAAHNSKKESAINQINTRVPEHSFYRYLTRTLILIIVIFALFLLNRNFSALGRYIPIESQHGTIIRILDTTNGSVYFVEKEDRTRSSHSTEGR